ncbi:MAG: hypothetical protein L3J73_03670, partial [Thermoplasmata archaeon]|nr:hypothetical protein [Thermoplasmata archaeon]
LGRSATAVGNVSITVPYCPSTGGGGGGAGAWSTQTLLPFVPAVVLAVLLAVVILWYRRNGPAAPGPTPIGRSTAPAGEAPGPAGPAAPEIEVGGARSAGPAPSAEPGPTSRLPVEDTRGDGSMGNLIILHLARQRRLAPGDVAPSELTQQGMETALGRPQSSFARALSRLEETGVVVAEIRHIRGAARRRKAYTLTSLGETLAKELRSRGPGSRPPP